MVRQLGEEVATSLNTANEQLTRLNRLEPGLVRSLAPIQDAVERARQAGMAAQHVLRLCEDPPPQRREVLNLADVAHAALTARSDWLRRRRIGVRKGFSAALVYADSSLLYQLIDELLLWVGQLGADIAISVESSQSTGRPRLQVISHRAPATAPAAVWRGVRWVLWHQLARALDAQTELDLKEQHVRISVSLPAATPEQIGRAAEEQVEPSSVSAGIAGCRVLIVSNNAQRRPVPAGAGRLRPDHGQRRGHAPGAPAGPAAPARRRGVRRQRRAARRRRAARAAAGKRRHARPSSRSRTRPASPTFTPPPSAPNPPATSRPRR
jgi:hypothetical protein